MKTMEAVKLEMLKLKNCGLSINKIADVSGIPYQTIWRITNELSLPKLKDLNKLEEIGLIDIKGRLNREMESHDRKE
jgi:transcriptional regulator with XRE-family HTH domain